jgi:hypothetical protein
MPGAGVAADRREALMGAEFAFDSLSRQLSGADDQTLVKIVSVVDRLARRGSLDRLLAQHRLRLAVIRPPRPMTLGRLLVLPFEELLVGPDHWSPGLMRVPRDRLARLIALTFERLPQGLEETLRRRLDGRTMDDAALALEIGREFWPAAALAVRRTLEHGRQTRDPEIRELQVPLRIAEQLLPVAEAVVTTVWALPPKPMLALDDAASERIADLLGRAAAEGRDCFQLVAELLVTRSELPLSIIRPVLAGAFDWGTRERHQAATMIAEACQNDMVRLYRGLAASPAATEPRHLVAPLQAIVSNVESLQEVAAEVRFDHRALRRLKAEVFELIQARLGVALEHGLLEPFSRLGDPSAAVDWRELEQNAAAVANMRLMARRIGLATKIDFLFTKALDRYRDLLVAAATAAGGEAWLQPLAMDRLRLIELVFGSRAAMQVLERLRQRPRLVPGREPPAGA